eukprot:1156271-Pelagomonas_calceolata.AAC.8
MLPDFSSRQTACAHTWLRRVLELTLGVNEGGKACVSVPLAAPCTWRWPLSALAQGLPVDADV